MPINIEEKLAEIEKRLNEKLPEVMRKHDAAVENSIDEPDHLRSGRALDEIERKRIEKEHRDEENQ